jgi:hypothetical protein
VRLLSLIELRLSSRVVPSRIGCTLDTIALTPAIKIAVICRYDQAGRHALRALLTDRTHASGLMVPA